MNSQIRRAHRAYARGLICTFVVVASSVVVLVRYLAQDDALQSQIATEFIERLSERDPGFVSVVAMTETAWVLERAYRLSAVEVAKAVERTLQADALVVESEQEVFTAMIALKEGHGSFADALIAALGAKAGCSVTVTSDRRALRLPGSRLLSAWRRRPLPIRHTKGQLP